MLKLNRLVPAAALAAILPVSALAAERAPAPTVSARVTSVAMSVIESLEEAVRGLVGETDQPRVEVVVAPKAGIVAAAAHHGPAAELRFKKTPEVERFVAYYAKGRGRLTTLKGLERSAEYQRRAEEIFREEGVPTRLVWLAQVESGWKSEAVSPVGAGGVWQFMPATARDFGMRVDEEVDERLDFEKATRASARYLRRLSRRYDGNWELAIGAYNCGEGNMDKAIERAGVADFWAISRAGELPQETIDYVPKVLAAGIVCCDPAEFGLATIR